MASLATLTPGASAAPTTGSTGVESGAVAASPGDIADALVTNSATVNAAAFQLLMTAADAQATVADALPVTAEAQLGQIVAVSTAASEPLVVAGRSTTGNNTTIKDTDKSADDPQPELTAALASMAFLPWPVTAPAEARMATAPVVKGAADAAVTAAGAKISRAAIADPESALAVQVAPLALQPAAAAAPVTATLLVDHDAANPLPADTTDRSATRPEAHAAIDVAASFTPISRAALPTPVVRSVQVPVHDPRWPQSIAAEVRWCADNGVQSATLKLTPENLGPLEMRVDIKDNQVNVTMTATHAETRQALEQSLPRLRELLSSSGLQLGQANVQQETRRESQMPASTLRGMLDEHSEDGFVPIRIAAGLVDEYA